jgi:hypothetical protein
MLSRGKAIGEWTQSRAGCHALQEKMLYAKKECSVTLLVLPDLTGPSAMTR